MDVLQWQHKAENQINATDYESVSDLEQKNLVELDSFERDIFDAYKSEMEKYFNSTILVQWKKNFEVRFQNLAREQISQAKDHFRMLLAGKNVISEFESKKAKILEDIELKVQENIKMIKKEQEILRESIERKELKSDHIKILLEGELFTKKKIMKYKTQGIREQVLQYITSNFETVTEHSLREFFYHSLTTEEVRIVLKHISIPEKKIEEKFDDIWRNLTSQIPRKVSRNADKVAKDTENALVSFITLHGYETKLRNKLCQMPLENWKDKQLTQPFEDKHYTVDCGSYWEKGKHLFGKHFTHLNNIQLKAIQIGNAALHEAKEHATLISKKNDDFTSTFVLQLLDKLDKSLQELCSEVSDYKISFKHDYKLEICLIACSRAIPVFEKMVDAFQKQHDPLENIN